MANLDNIIKRYKHIRSISELRATYSCQYALVGVGNHCVSNLLPVIQYLQLPLKYICCTSDEKALLISQKYNGVKGTANLNDILDDKTILGVFVAASPHEHFKIARKVIKAGKSLFIEKPPCENEEQLHALTDSIRLYGPCHVVVGLQRRFAPVTQILRRLLRKADKHHYLYRYHTGLYPEGDALLELFIHPLDYVVFLFGEARLKAVNAIQTKNGGLTLMLMLEHHGITGMLELSTDYSWHNAKEELSISTSKGCYTLSDMESLDFSQKHSSFWGIPLEKLMPSNTTITRLHARNAFLPTLGNNQIVAQGFFDEIKSFADMVENKCEDTFAFGFESLKHTYSLMAKIRERVQYAQ